MGRRDETGGRWRRRSINGRTIGWTWETYLDEIPRKAEKEVAYYLHEVIEYEEEEYVPIFDRIDK